MENQPTLERITRIAAITINPGDVIVLECDRKITHEQAETIIKKAQEYFPGHKVMILPPDLHLAVANTNGHP